MRRGFTLIELLLVMVILLVMMSLASSSATALRHRGEVRASANRYVSKHSLARAIAVRMGRTSQLRVDTAAGRIWVEVVHSATARDTIGSVDTFDPRLIFRSDRTVLCFDARGLAKSGGMCEAADATVIFSLTGKSDTVRVSALGRVMR